MIEIIELFRDTQDSVGLKELDAMNPLARDRALRQEMKADGNLHPALFSSKQHYEVSALTPQQPPFLQQTSPPPPWLKGMSRGGHPRC